MQLAVKYLVRPPFNRSACIRARLAALTWLKAICAWAGKPAPRFRAATRAAVPAATALEQGKRVMGRESTSLLVAIRWGDGNGITSHG
jgi:hypothetical protein